MRSVTQAFVEVMVSSWATAVLGETATTVAAVNAASTPLNRALARDAADAGRDLEGVGVRGVAIRGPFRVPVVTALSALHHKIPDQHPPHETG
jgi:hypothetical protein